MFSHPRALRLIKKGMSVCLNNLWNRAPFFWSRKWEWDNFHTSLRWRVIFLFVCPHLWQKGAKEVLLAKQTYSKIPLRFSSDYAMPSCQRSQRPKLSTLQFSAFNFLAALKIFDYALDVFLLAPVLTYFPRNFCCISFTCVHARWILWQKMHYKIFRVHYFLDS